MGPIVTDYVMKCVHIKTQYLNEGSMILIGSTDRSVLDFICGMDCVIVYVKKCYVETGFF